MTAEEIITRLGLQPHPEGGHFRETFRDPATSPDGRAASTAIYFLLAAGEVSRWHRVDAAEVWHYHVGAPLEIVTKDDAGRRDVHRLGIDFGRGEQPQVVVPRSAWQMARSLGAWTLVGCTVAPGFEFSGFEMLPHGQAP